MEETVAFGENHRHVTYHWQTESNNTVSSTPRHELTSLVVIGTNYTVSSKSKYNAMTTTTIQLAMVYVRINRIYLSCTRASQIQYTFLHHNTLCIYLYCYIRKCTDAEMLLYSWSIYLYNCFNISQMGTT